MADRPQSMTGAGNPTIYNQTPGVAEANRDGLVNFYPEGSWDFVGNNSQKSQWSDMEQPEENYRTRTEKKHGRKD